MTVSRPFIALGERLKRLYQRHMCRTDRHKPKIYYVGAVPVNECQRPECKKLLPIILDRKGTDEILETEGRQCQGDFVQDPEDSC